MWIVNFVYELILGTMGACAPAVPLPCSPHTGVLFFKMLEKTKLNRSVSSELGSRPSLYSYFLEVLRSWKKGQSKRLLMA
jgi:hypothetical protein